MLILGAKSAGDGEWPGRVYSKSLRFNSLTGINFLTQKI